MGGVSVLVVNVNRIDGRGIVTGVIGQEKQLYTMVLPECIYLVIQGGVSILKLEVNLPLCVAYGCPGQPATLSDIDGLIAPPPLGVI